MRGPDRSTTRDLRTAAIVVVICSLALALRLLGAQFGLPAVFNPDEVAIMNRAMAFATRDLNPHNFLYPTLYFYVLFAWESLFFVFGRAAGLYDSVAAFQHEFFIDPSRIFLAGRVLSALLGTLTVWATYRFAARIGGRAVGMAAALFLAVAPFAVRDAHYVKHDVPVTLLIVLTHVVIAGVVLDPERRARMRGWIVAGALAGLAMSTHYYAIFVALPLAGAALLSFGPREPVSTRMKRLVIAGVSAFIAFALTSPFIFVEPTTFWRDVVGNRAIVMDRAVAGTGVFSSFTHYASMLAHDAIGWPVLAAALLCAVVMLIADRRRALLLLAFPIPFLLFISNTFPAGRYLNPMLPMLATLAGLALVRAGTIFGGQTARVTAALTVAAATPGLLASVNTGLFFRQPDTRTLAQQFIEREIAPGTSILVQPYGVPIRRTRESLLEGLRAHGLTETTASIKFRSQLTLTPYPAPAYRTIYLGRGGQDVDLIYVDPSAFDATNGLAPLRALGISYVVRTKSGSLAEFAALDLSLIREGQLATTFSPYRTGVPPEQLASVLPFIHNTDARIDAALERPGPIVEIWRVR